VAGSILGGSLLMALAAALPLFYGWMELDLVRNLRRSTRAWEEGVEAAYPRLEGKQFQDMHHVWVDYDLTLRYRTKALELRRCRLHFGRFFTGPRLGDPFTARYVPSDPDCATISWAYEARGHGWVAVVLFGTVAALMACGATWMAIRVWCRLLLVRRLAVGGQIVLAPIVGVGCNWHWSEFGPHHTTVYRYLLPHRPERTHGHETYKRFNQPLISEGWLVVLAAVSSDEHVVLKHNGSPLVLPIGRVGPTWR
jgi:hypothetical protein